MKKLVTIWTYSWFDLMKWLLWFNNLQPGEFILVWFHGLNEISLTNAFLRKFKWWTSGLQQLRFLSKTKTSESATGDLRFTLKLVQCILCKNKNFIRSSLLFFYWMVQCSVAGELLLACCGIVSIDGYSLVSIQYHNNVWHGGISSTGNTNCKYRNNI